MKTLLNKVTILLVVLLVIPGLILFADQAKDNQKPKIKKGAKVVTVKGTLRSWKDADKTPLNLRNKPRKMKPILNFERNLPLVKKTVDNDPVVQDSHGANSLERGRLMPTPDISFAGMNFNSNGAGWPPDTTGDVGTTYYIQGVNTSIGIYRKSTGALVSATTFDSFFGGTGITGTPSDGDNNGDPIILYDWYESRWFILDFAWDPSENDGSYFSIAVSKTSDPTGDWWQYAFRADNSLMNDYPKCGIWHDGIYITANMFQFSGSYQHTKVWALKKPDIYNGTLTAQYITDSSDQAFSLMPVHAKGTTAPPTSAPCYIYAQDADEYGSGHYDAIYVWKYDVDWNNSNNTTWTGHSTMTTASYGLVATDVPQSGTSTTLDSLYGRLMNPAIYRNFGTHESVYLCHVAEYSSRRAMRWYEVRISGGNSSIYQQGTYSPDSNHRWMGSVCGDKYGNIAMGYSVSSSSMYPAIRYCGRLSTDPLGQMSQGENTLVNGSGSQTSYQRWGDYSSISIDPSDDETFWYTQEYYTSTGTNWQTRIGSFKVGGGTPPPDLSDAVDSTESITTSGDANWSTDTSTYYYDNDSAKSGTITHNQSTTLTASVNFSAAKDVKFYWKVSSESGYDYLKFYIDGVEQDSIAGTVDWTQKTFSLSSGSHTLTWTYTKDGSVDGGSDCGWVDKVEFEDGGTPVNDIGDGLDNTTLTYTTSGNGDWDYDTSDYYYDNDSIKSPVITHSQSASVTTTVNYASNKTVKFYWKVSSETNYDYLRFYIDDVLQDQISGTTASWAQKSYAISSGSHTLKWTYYKDGSVSSGSDCGWVDKLEIEDGGTVTDPIAEALDISGPTFSLSGDEEWYVTTGDYYYGGSSVTVPAALNHNEQAIMQTTVSGYTSVSFYWKVSSESGYDYLEFYIDDVLQDQISGTSSWAQKSYSISSGSHTLKWIYDKDYSVSSGSDTGWVDRLVLN